MRVLHLNSGNLYGGVERLLGTLAWCRARASGMQPEFGLCFRGRHYDELVAAAVPVSMLGPVRLSRPWSVWGARRRLAARLRETPPTLAVVHSAWLEMVFAPVLRRVRQPWVRWTHNFATDAPWWQRLPGRAQPRLTLASSEAVARSVAQFAPRSPVVLCHYPLRMSGRTSLPAGAESQDGPGVARALRAELNTPAAGVAILQVSRLEAWKGHALLLNALARVGGGNWVCWIAGGAQRAKERRYLAALRQQAARAGLADRVRFLGERADVDRLLRAADVFCQANTSPEPFGLALVEALHAGLPVVTANWGGAVEIVSADCGVLVEPRHPAALAGALRTLVNDAALRRRLAAAGPGRAAALCAPERQMPHLETLLRSCLE